MQIRNESARRRPMAAGRLRILIRSFSIAIVVASAGTSVARTEAIDAQMKTALALHQRGDYAHSVPLLVRLVQASPKDYLANLLLGEDLFLSGKPADALPRLRAAAELRPDDVSPLDYEAAAADSLRDFVTEATVLEAALDRSKQDEKHLVAWGNFCLNRFEAVQTKMLATTLSKATELRLSAWGQAEGSEDKESMLAKSAALDPEQRGIWGELGIAQVELGQQTEAQATVKEAILREPRSAETLRLEALLAASANDWHTAEEKLLAVGKTSSAEMNKALIAWPRTLIPGAEVAGAIWDCLRNATIPCQAISDVPGDGAPMMPHELFSDGRWEQLAALSNPVNENKQEWAWRGISLVRSGDCFKAIPALERGFDRDNREDALYLQFCYETLESDAEDRLNAQGNGGGFHELRGDLEMIVGNDAEAAAKDYAEALKTSPRDSHLLAKWGEACLMTDGPGNSARARTAAMSALAINPHETQAVQIMAEIALYQRNYSEAVARLRQLDQLQPANAWCKVELGVAYLQLGQPAPAVRYLEPQLRAGYPDPKGQLHGQLAAALKKLGRTQEAVQAAAEASRLANATLENGAHEGTDAP
jgi:tetratricopeptide (TPR) repeat protein